MPTNSAADFGHGTETRVALLVAGPLRRLVHVPLRWVCRAARSTTQPIDFNSTNITSLPAIRDSENYARHLALAVVDLSIWTDSSMTLWDKLGRAKFWEHQGHSPLFMKARRGENGNGETRDGKGISVIDSIEYVGQIHHSDHVISQHFFPELWNDWSYDPVWWNCHDFALRLCYLLLDANDQAAKNRVAFLAKWFRVGLVQGTVSLRGRAIDLSCLVNAVFNPSLSIFPLPRWLCKPFAKLDQRKIKKWEANMDKLDWMIPGLKGFHTVQRACVEQVKGVIAAKRHKHTLRTMFSLSDLRQIFLDYKSETISAARRLRSLQ